MTSRSDGSSSSVPFDTDRLCERHQRSILESFSRRQSTQSRPSAGRTESGRRESSGTGRGQQPLTREVGDDASASGDRGLPRALGSRGEAHNGVVPSRGTAAAADTPSVADNQRPPRQQQPAAQGEGMSATGDTTPLCDAYNRPPRGAERAAGGQADSSRHEPTPSAQGGRPSYDTGYVASDGRDSPRHEQVDSSGGTGEFIERRDSALPAARTRAESANHERPNRSSPPSSHGGARAPPPCEPWRWVRPAAVVEERYTAAPSRGVAVVKKRVVGSSPWLEWPHRRTPPTRSPHSACDDEDVWRRHPAERASLWAKSVGDLYAERFRDVLATETRRRYSLMMDFFVTYPHLGTVAPLPRQGPGKATGEQGGGSVSEAASAKPQGHQRSPDHLSRRNSARPVSRRSDESREETWRPPGPPSVLSRHSIHVDAPHWHLVRRYRGRDLQDAVAQDIASATQVGPRDVTNVEFAEKGQVIRCTIRRPRHASGAKVDRQLQQCTFPRMWRLYDETVDLVDSVADLDRRGGHPNHRHHHGNNGSPPPAMHWTERPPPHAFVSRDSPTEPSRASEPNAQTPSEDSVRATRSVSHRPAARPSANAVTSATQTEADVHAQNEPGGTTVAASPSHREAPDPAPSASAPKEEAGVLRLTALVPTAHRATAAPSQSAAAAATPAAATVVLRECQIVFEGVSSADMGEPVVADIQRAVARDCAAAAPFVSSVSVRAVESQPCAAGTRVIATVRVACPHTVELADVRHALSACPFRETWPILRGHASWNDDEKDKEVVAVKLGGTTGTAAGLPAGKHSDGEEGGGTATVTAKPPPSPLPRSASRESPVAAKTAEAVSEALVPSYESCAGHDAGGREQPPQLAHADDGVSALTSQQLQRQQHVLERVFPGGVWEALFPRHQHILCDVFTAETADLLGVSPHDVDLLSAYTSKSPSSSDTAPTLWTGLHLRFRLASHAESRAGTGRWHVMQTRVTQHPYPRMHALCAALTPADGHPTSTQPQVAERETASPPAPSRLHASYFAGSGWSRLVARCPDMLREGFAHDAAAVLDVPATDITGIRFMVVAAQSRNGEGNEDGGDGGGGAGLLVVFTLASERGDAVVSAHHLRALADLRHMHIMQALYDSLAGDPTAREAVPQPIPTPVAQAKRHYDDDTTRKASAAVAGLRNGHLGHPVPLHHRNEDVAQEEVAAAVPCVEFIEDEVVAPAPVLVTTAHNMTLRGSRWPAILSDDNGDKAVRTAFAQDVAEAFQGFPHTELASVHAATPVGPDTGDSATVEIAFSMTHPTALSAPTIADTIAKGAFTHLRHLYSSGSGSTPPVSPPAAAQHHTLSMEEEEKEDTAVVGSTSPATGASGGRVSVSSTTTPPPPPPGSPRRDPRTSPTPSESVAPALPSSDGQGPTSPSHPPHRSESTPGRRESLRRAAELLAIIGATKPQEVAPATPAAAAADEDGLLYSMHTLFVEGEEWQRVVDRSPDALRVALAEDIVEANGAAGSSDGDDNAGDVSRITGEGRPVALVAAPVATARGLVANYALQRGATSLGSRFEADRAIERSPLRRCWELYHGTMAANRSESPQMPGGSLTEAQPLDKGEVTPIDRRRGHQERFPHPPRRRDGGEAVPLSTPPSPQTHAADSCLTRSTDASVGLEHPFTVFLEGVEWVGIAARHGEELCRRVEKDLRSAVLPLLPSHATVSAAISSLMPLARQGLLVHCAILPVSVKGLGGVEEVGEEGEGEEGEGQEPPQCEEFPRRTQLEAALSSHPFYNAWSLLGEVAAPSTPAHHKATDSEASDNGAMKRRSASPAPTREEAPRLPQMEQRESLSRTTSSGSSGTPSFALALKAPSPSAAAASTTPDGALTQDEPVAQLHPSVQLRRRDSAEAQCPPPRDQVAESVSSTSAASSVRSPERPLASSSRSIDHPTAAPATADELPVPPPAPQTQLGALQSTDAYVARRSIALPPRAEGASLAPSPNGIVVLQVSSPLTATAAETVLTRRPASTSSSSSTTSDVGAVASGLPPSPPSQIAEVKLAEERIPSQANLAAHTHHTDGAGVEYHRRRRSVRAAAVEPPRPFSVTLSSASLLSSFSLPAVLKPSAQAVVAPPRPTSRDACHHSCHRLTSAAGESVGQPEPSTNSAVDKTSLSSAHGVPLAADQAPSPQATMESPAPPPVPPKEPDAQSDWWRVRVVEESATTNDAAAAAARPNSDFAAVRFPFPTPPMRRDAASSPHTADRAVVSFDDGKRAKGRAVWRGNGDEDGAWIRPVPKRQQPTKDPDGNFLVVFQPSPELGTILNRLDVAENLIKERTRRLYLQTL